MNENCIFCKTCVPRTISLGDRGYVHIACLFKAWNDANKELDSIKEMLPDTLYPGSKDWVFDSAPKERIDYLLSRVQSLGEEVGIWLDNIERAKNENAALRKALRGFMIYHNSFGRERDAEVNRLLNNAATALDKETMHPKEDATMPLYTDNPEFVVIRFESALHEQTVANELFNSKDHEGAILTDRDNVLAFVFDESKAEQLKNQLNLAHVAYETMKEIVNAADGIDPYDNAELIEIISPLLAEMRNAGIRGQGEM